MVEVAVVQDVRLRVEFIVNLTKLGVIGCCGLQCQDFDIGVWTRRDTLTIVHKYMLIDML